MAFDPITAGLDLVGKVIDRVWPDPAAEIAAKLDILKLQLGNEVSLLLGQLEINKAEASSSSIFVAGWRPAIGWICAAALAYQYILRPLVAWGFAISGNPIPIMPGLDGNLWELMMGMLGLGGLRTFEKVKGAA